MADKYFQIEITQTISRVLEIQAVDLESAINDVREQYGNGDIVLGMGSNDLVISEIKECAESEQPKKFEVNVLFGTTHYRNISEGCLTEDMKQDIVTKVFNTEDEKLAYQQALADMDGWDNYAELSDEDLEKIKNQ